MEDRQDDSSLSSSDDESTNSKHSSIPQLNNSSKEAGYHHLYVHCLSKKKALKGKRYISVDQIKIDAFALFEDYKFNDGSAILTHFNENKAEVVLTFVPSLLKNSSSKHLFIRFVCPICALCSNPFGIFQSELPLQCATVKCGVQYCNTCVQAIQGSPPKLPFDCIVCKKRVTPRRNILIENHIIWKSMCKLYGIQDLEDLKEKSDCMSCDQLQKNINYRLIHLKSGFQTLETRLDSPISRVRKQDSRGLLDDQLINNVKCLYGKLENLNERVKGTDKEMTRRGVIVGECLEEYKEEMKHFDHVCDRLSQSIEKLERNENNFTINKDDAQHKEYIKSLYRMNSLQKLSSEQNVKAIDTILEDVVFRKTCLSRQIETITSLLEGKPDEIKHLEKNLKKAKQKLDRLSVIEDKLSYLCGNLRAIERYVNEYDGLLRDDQFQTISCSKFILLLEEMRVLTAELQLSENFPQTCKLMQMWQSDYSTDDQFKPKVIDLFKAIEMDVKSLFENDNYIYSVPYKIGVIGEGSVGKSALVINLANLKEFSSMVDIERSTFGYLQFDTLLYKDPQNNKIIPITFVDIEGATDTEKCPSIGNYIELITKANCDVYFIVIDKPFHDHNRICQEYIEKTLGRRCLLVRSKADLLFKQYFQEKTEKEEPNERAYRMKIALNKVKDYVLKTFNDTRLTQTVFLTAAACNDHRVDESFTVFDLEELKKQIVQLAVTDLREERIYALAVRTAIIIINTCFRRGYTVSKAKYTWLAAGASVVPFLDEIPAFFGREKIRQTIGVHDKKKVPRAKDAFEEYLTTKTIMVPKDVLKSAYFSYLKPEKKQNQTANSKSHSLTYVQQKLAHNVENKSPTFRKTQTCAGHAVGNVVRPAVTGLSIAGKVVDDAARLLVPVSSATLRGISIAGIVIGAVLTPVFAAWSFYSTSRRMNEHLHLLCDDLIVVSHYFAINLCSEYCKRIEQPILAAAENNCSSSDDDSSTSDRDESDSSK